MANSFRSMPGDCPVKQSKNPRLLRFKKERRKKKKRALVWNAIGGRLGQVAEHWRVGSCSPGQNSLVAVHGGYCHFYAYVKVVRFHPLCPKWAAAP